MGFLFFRTMLYVQLVYQKTAISLFVSNVYIVVKQCVERAFHMKCKNRIKCMYFQNVVTILLLLLNLSHVGYYCCCYCYVSLVFIIINIVIIQLVIVISTLFIIIFSASSHSFYYCQYFRVLFIFCCIVKSYSCVIILIIVVIDGRLNKRSQYFLIIRLGNSQTVSANLCCSLYTNPNIQSPSFSPAGK